MWIFNEDILCILLYYNKSCFYTIKILSLAIIKTICLTKQIFCTINMMMDYYYIQLLKKIKIII